MTILPSSAGTADHPPSLGRTRISSRVAGSRILNLLGPFIGLAVVIAFFSVFFGSEARSHFLNLGNLRLVASQTVIVALAALGMTIIIISGGIDLSVGSGIALASVVAALLLHAGKPVVLATLAAVATGAVLGLINGGVTAGLKVTPFIVTLGTLGAARGVAKWMAAEQTVNAPDTWLNRLADTVPQPSWLLVSPGVWVTLFLGLLTAGLLRYTRFGRYTVAIGSNEVACRLSGLRVDAWKLAIYGVAGLFIGLAGVFQFARLGQGDPTSAVGEELDVIAAVVIGGASLNGGEGSILGSILGALIMSFLRNGAVILGWPTYVQEIIIGAVIVAAVALDRLRHRSGVRRPKPAAA